MIRINLRNRPRPWAIRSRYWYTLADVARELGRSRKTVDSQHRDERRFRTTRLGRGRVILVAQHCVEAEREGAVCECREWPPEDDEPEGARALCVDAKPVSIDRVGPRKAATRAAA